MTKRFGFMTLDATLPQASTSNTHLHSLHEYARTHCHFRSSLLTPLLEEAVTMRPVESASSYPWHLDAGGDHAWRREFSY
ncbi:hypothetical protein HZ326_28340 [Fusarium oxysporum f. sp. albedinis]|nr:hypothetical protein HZ326_28340 [Fusarium oxysporum f. sp. albedinis]